MQALLNKTWNLTLQLKSTIENHEKVLNILVNKSMECPKLVWFYPKKRTMWNWIVDPWRMLLTDSMMMVFVCPVTLKVVRCGPNDVGWEVTNPKEWVRKWGPAILISLQVLQVAVVAGRILGIPLPHVPDVSDIMHFNSSKALQAFSSMRQAVIEQASNADCDLKRVGHQFERALSDSLATEDHIKVTKGSYEAIVQFVSQFGPIESQLRGKMEKYHCNGNVEWVSLEGKDEWFRKQQSVSTLMSTDASTIHVTTKATSSTIVSSTTTAVSTMTSTQRNDIDGHYGKAEDELWIWLEDALGGRGRAKKDNIQHCYQCFHESSIFSVQDICDLPSNEFTHDELKAMGIQLVGLRNAIMKKYQSMHCISTTPTKPHTEDDAVSSQRVEELEKQLKQVQVEVSKVSMIQTSNSDMDVQDVNAGGGLMFARKKSIIQNVHNDQNQDMLRIHTEKTEIRIAQMEKVLTYLVDDVMNVKQILQMPEQPEFSSEVDTKEDVNKNKLFTKS